MTTSTYEKRIMNLYFNGYYDFLDISRIINVHPDELIDIMLNKGMILNKRELGGYSAYKLFNDIDERLWVIEQKLNKNDKKLFDDEYDFNEKDIVFDDDDEYSDIYDVLLDDGEEYDSEYTNEDAEPEEEKDDNGYVKFEEEKDDEDIVKEKANKNTQTQSNCYEKNCKNNDCYSVSSLKNLFFSIFEDGVLGNTVFLSAVLCNVSILLVGFFHYCNVHYCNVHYCK